MYAMKLKFYSDQFMEGAFPGTDFQLSNGRDSYIEQTVWFIPDPETLSHYASIIEEGLNKSFEPAHIKFRNTRFMTSGTAGPIMLSDMVFSPFIS